MEQLKPCPFCGGKAKLRYAQPLAVVQCKKCKAFGQTEADDYEVGDSKQKAIEAWNRRADVLVPRVRGKWEHGREIGRTMLVDKTLAIEYEDWHCSACGCVVEDYEFPRYKFCPNCGADMRGEKDG